MTEPEDGRNVPTCPLCQGRTWQRAEGKVDSAWGLTAHRMILLVCQTCSHVLFFYDGNTIFDFD